MKFLKDNWFRIIILLLSILLVSSVINYINTAAHDIVQRQNFSIWKWYVDEVPKGSSTTFDLLLERFGL